MKYKKKRRVEVNMRRLFILLLTVVIVVAGMPATDISADLTNDIGVSYRLSESTTIKKNEYFTIYLSFSKENSDVKKVSIDMIDNNFFREINGSLDINDVDFIQEYSFELQYLGGSNKLPLSIRIDYEDSHTETGTYNVVIDEIEEDSVTPPYGSSDSEPKLVIESASIPAATAGDTMQIPLTITNESRYTARNITVKLSLDDSENSPFEMDSLNLVRSISSLSPNKSEGVIFNLRVKPYAEEKTYEINVEFKYYNTRNSYFTSSEKIYVKVTNNKNEPVLLIQDIKYSANPVKAGEKFQVSFSVANMGDLDAEGVRISIQGLSTDGFTLSSGVDNYYFDRIRGNEKKNIILSLASADSMKSGNYSLEVKMDYKNQRNEKLSDSSGFFISVQGESKASNVTLNDITVMPREVRTGENFIMGFNVYNGGKSDARNVKVTVKGEENIISKSPDVVIIENLAAGESKKLEFIMYANDEAKTRNHNIMINLEYEDAEKEGSLLSVTQYAGVYVNGGSSKIIPKIIISNYSFEPKLVRAGEEFSMELAFMNTSSTKEVKNIKIYLTGIDSNKEGNVVFTPVGSSNTFFVDSIKPKGTAVRNITMYTIPDAEPKYYNITANIEYQDEDGTEYKAEELIGIPVIQQSRLDASEISLPPEIFVGQPVPVSLQYYNKGKTKLSNLMIKVEGDFQVENGETFIGNFESGSSDYFEAMITALKPGTANGKIIFTFEDPSGEEFSYEREFTISAVEMPPMPMPGDIPPEPVSLKDRIMGYTIKNLYFWVGIAVVAAAIFTARKLIKNKRRKVMELDE